MKNKDLQDEILTVVERFWDERLPDRDGLYELFYKEMDTAVDNLIAEVARREAEVDYQHMLSIARGVTK